MDKEIGVELESKPSRPSGWGKRHTLAILGFWAFAISYAMRFNLSLAIVAMVHSKEHKLSNHSLFQNFSSSDTCPKVNGHSDQKQVDEQGEFYWSESEQGIILGSFFYGYVLTQLPGGILSDMYGGKHPLGLGLLLTAIFAILTPVAARSSKYLLIVVRIIQGLGEGLTTPAMHEILANWSPPHERSQMASIVYAGAQFGTACTMILSGYLIHDFGWPSVFYTIGSFSILWYVLWTWFMYDHPSEHPSISPEELHYIEASIGKHNLKARISTPWKKIFTSMPVYAIIVGHVGHAYGLYTLLTELPTYMKNVLGFDIKQNSLISALPYIVFWILSIVFCWIADILISRGIMKTVHVRKTFQAIAQIGAAIALIIVSYAGCDRIVIILLLTIAIGINGAIYAGYVVNHVDIANNHSGVLMGVTNTFANICGFVAPGVAGKIIDGNPQSLFRWQIVFFITAGIYLIDVIFYTIFGTADEQEWNRAEPVQDKDKNEIELN